MPVIKLDPRGHLPLSADVCQALQISPGDEVTLLIRDGHVVLTTHRQLLDQRRRQWREDGNDITHTLDVARGIQQK